jgi:proteic killer suppression protein
MIKTLNVKKKQLYEGKRDGSFESFSRQAEKRLRTLESANNLDVLKALPSNRFEVLSGDRNGQYSIRVNIHWRICFTWAEDGACGVEIVDYH